MFGGYCIFIIFNITSHYLISLCAKYFQNWWWFSLCWFQATSWDKKWLMGQKVPIHPLLFPVYENINFVPGCSSKISPVLPKFTVRILKTTQAEKISCSKAKNITAEQAQSIFLEDDFNIHLWQTEKQKVVFTLGPTGRNIWFLAQLFGYTISIIDEKLISIIVIIMFM